MLKQFTAIPKRVSPLIASFSSCKEAKEPYYQFVYDLQEKGDKALEGQVQIQKLFDLHGKEVVKSDAKFFKERESIPMHLRPTLTYQELVEYDKWREALPEAEKQKYPPSLDITGGKGRSLSLMDDVVDVPQGYNVTTAAYFQFVRDNPEIYKKIETELATLDTMDDQKRDIVTAEIREVIQRGKYPENIRTEVLAQYRNLNYQRAKSAKPIPTGVAIRSSGTKEDIKVESWLPITTGSQAGQSDTFLNVKGDEDVLSKLQYCWGSLFTDRATSYRDDAIFLIWSAIIGFEGKKPKDVYYELMDKLAAFAEKNQNQHMKEIAEVLDTLKNPGSVNLMECIEEVLATEKNGLLEHCLVQLRTAAQEVVHPQQIGIDVVIMQMVQSYISGVLFTVNPPTRQAGVAQALWQAWNKGDKSLVHLNEQGQINGTRPIIMSFEVAFGYGENVVGGKVDPDRFVTATYNGKDWFVLEKRKGTKLIQMIDIQESLEIMDKSISQKTVTDLANKVQKIVEYIEIGKKMAGILTTHMYGMKYFKELNKEETDHQKKQRLQLIAGELSDLVKDKQPSNVVKDLIVKHFYVAEAGKKGITSEQIDKVMANSYKLIEEAFKEMKEGEKELLQFFDGKKGMTEDFLLMLRETWENNTFDVKQRQAVLDKLKLNAHSIENLAYTIRTLIDGTFTCNQLTHEQHRNEFCISDEIAFSISKMAWNIASYYEEKMDVEFAIEIDPNAPAEKKLVGYCLDKEGNRIKVQEDGSSVPVKKDVYGLTKADETGMRLYNVQARPYTAGHATVDFVRQRVELHEEFQAVLPKELARGTLGDNATIGYVLVFDPNKTIDQHAETVKRLKRGEFNKEEIAQIKEAGFDPEVYITDKTKKISIVLYLLEADPSHDPLMRLVNAVATIRGGETCHAAIFCREQGIPAVCGVGKFEIKDGNFMIVNANTGRLYKYGPEILKQTSLQLEEVLVPVKARIKPYLIPYEQGDTKSGYILAAESVAQQLSPTMLAKDASGIALSRAEFKGEELGVNVVAGYAYDMIKKIERGEIKENTLTEFQAGLVKDLRNHSWIIDQLEEWLKVAGYFDFRTFMERNFYYFYNNLGFHLAPNQINKARAYDFAQDKVQGLIGSEVFSWRGKNPLVGLRGASLEIKDVVHDENYNIQHQGYQEILQFLFEANLKANINTGNQGWFYVFIRTERELQVIANIIRETGKKHGALPAEIGMMVEVPSNCLLVEKLGGILKKLEADGAQYGLKKIFFSFGTNDYTNLAGKTDREDPRIQNLKIMDSAAKKELKGLKEQGFFLNTTDSIIPMALEGSDTLIQLIEHVCAYGFENKVDLSLCGQAIVKLVEMGMPDQAGKIMSLLTSFGVDPKNRLPSSMLRFDSMRILDTITTPENARKVVFPLDKSMGKGVVKGEVVFVEKDEDFIPKELQGLNHDDFDEKKRIMLLNDPYKTSTVGDKIVVINGKVSNVEELERKGIDWDDLQYAKAIIIDSKFADYKNMEIFDPKKSISAGRVKGIANVGDLKALAGKQVTIDYTSGKCYEGALEVVQTRPEMRKFNWVKEAPKVPEQNAVCECANDAYKSMGLHPLVLLAYRDNKLNSYEKNFYDHAQLLLEEAQKISETTISSKKAYLLKHFKAKLENENGSHKQFFLNTLKDVEAGKNILARAGELKGVATAYFEDIKQDIKKRIGNKKIDQFIIESFKNNMVKVAKANQGKAICHVIGTLNCTDFQSMKGGIVAEQINPNPDYGLLGASRSISDFWEISRMEIEAYKQAKKEIKDLKFLVAEVKGVQSAAITHLVLSQLKDCGVVPGKDGHEIGVQIATPADTITVEQYLQQGYNFVTYNNVMLGCAWAGVDVYWDQWEKLLARKTEMEELGDQAIRFVKSKVDAVNKQGKYGEKKVVNL